MWGNHCWSPVLGILSGGVDSTAKLVNLQVGQTQWWKQYVYGGVANLEMAILYFADLFLQLSTCTLRVPIFTVFEQDYM